MDGQSWKKIESLNLFSGETQTLRLVIRNTGSVPALGLDLRWVGEEGEPPDLELDKTLINDNLPLKPGKCILSFMHDCRYYIRKIFSMNSNEIKFYFQ